MGQVQHRSLGSPYWRSIKIVLNNVYFIMLDWEYRQKAAAKIVIYISLVVVPHVQKLGFA